MVDQTTTHFSCLSGLHSCVSPNICHEKKWLFDRLELLQCEAQWMPIFLCLLLVLCEVVKFEEQLKSDKSEKMLYLKAHFKMSVSLLLFSKIAFN